MESYLEKKIYWQCKRGLQELDSILIPFVKNHFSELQLEERALFQHLLTFQDIELMDWLVNRVEPSEKGLIKIINLVMEKHKISYDQK